jgi:hypothetical protein
MIMRTENNEEPQAELWSPDQGRRSSAGDTVEDVVNAYLLFLEVRHPDHLKLFRDRLKMDPDAAKAEAVVFSWLRRERCCPRIAESPRTGGADYRCIPESKNPFLVEVTHLDRDAVKQRSGWPDQLSDIAHTFSMITPNLRSKTQAKVPQLAGQDAPRVLAICLAHVGASALLGTLAAEWLMISELRIEMPIALEGEPAPARTVTDLKKSAFFRLHEGAIVPVRQSISAILLIAIWEDQLEVVGMLHPAPAAPFDYHTFGDVPFLRVAWPIAGNAIRTEWVVGHPSPSRCYHSKVTMTDGELRGE